MKWRRTLPIALLILALGCHIYEPHQYRERARLDRVTSNMEYTFQHSPASIGRLSQGINFPALVLDYPLKDQDGAIYSKNSDYTLIWIAPKDLGFFAGILVLWYWVGRSIDERLAAERRRPAPRIARIAGLICGIVFAGLTGAYAYRLVSSEWLPEREIGLFGLAWAAILSGYFGWRLGREFRSKLFVVAACIALVACSSTRYSAAVAGTVGSATTGKPVMGVLEQ